MSASGPKKSRVSRRTFLRGAGVTMALPWLESVPVWGSDPMSGGTPAACPKRFAALFMACGINSNHWWAKGAGADMVLGKSLEPLAPLRTKLNVVSGLFNKNATGVGIHPGQTGNLLSGAALQKGAELKGDISVDQVMANKIGQETVQPSMVLGCEQPITGYHETNFSMAYSSHISWQSDTSPVPMEVYPSLAFDALFGGRGDCRTRSVLDAVRGDAASLSNRVSGADRARLDEYLTSVREVEKRVAPARASQGLQDRPKGERRSAPTLRGVGGVNKAGGAWSSSRHRVEVPGVCLELLSALLDGAAFGWGFDGAEPNGLGGDLVYGPACWLRRFRLARHAVSIGRKVSWFNIGSRSTFDRLLTIVRDAVLVSVTVASPAST